MIILGTLVKLKVYCLDNEPGSLGICVDKYEKMMVV